MDTDFYVWTKVLIYLRKHQDENPTALKICKDLDISTVSGVSLIFKMLKHKGLIKYERKGRNNSYTLTTKGMNLAELLDKAMVMVK